MTRPARATQAEIKHAILAAQQAGLRVLGIQPDGTVVVDDGEGPHPYARVTADIEDDDMEIS